MKLIPLLLETDNLSSNLKDLNLVDDALKKALEDASKEAPTNEIIGTTLFVIALPALVKLFVDIVEKIANSNGINLKKSNSKWLSIVKDIANRLDDYVDTPIRTVLKPFIQEEDQRKKIAKIIKAILLVLAASAPAFGDLEQAPEITSTIKELVPDLAERFIKIINDKTNAFVSIKKVLVSYFK